VVRAEDVVGRWGGEEFVILLPQADQNDGVIVAEHLRAAVAAHRFLEAGVPWPQTVTIGGIAMRNPKGLSITRLLEAVDACLYRAKDLGRNRALLERWEAEDRR
jgi:diguanylate cyclase (GGDEF)-like protein